MTLAEFVERERENLNHLVHPDPTEERTWYCEPLLVIDDEGVVAFEGRTNVFVKPFDSETADLIADGDRDGWRPSLVRAKVRSYAMHVAMPYGGRSRGGLICDGEDAEGNRFAWYINGAAESYCARRLALHQIRERTADLPPDEEAAVG